MPIPHRMLHGLAIAIAATPALALLARFAIEGPGPEPIEDLTHMSGEWGLRCILASLAITPLRRWLGWRRLAPLRRTLGLAGFAYACLHLLTWGLLEHALDASAILEDLAERPYVMVGMAAFALLLPLALTSTRGWMKRLGRDWVRLHRLVYLAAALAVLHHFWLVKADYAPPIAHAALLAGLLTARAPRRGERER
ncbi:MAG: sulfoxide reductase heme-binding subunit YedZ [Deltaproteobacteria bacterium]|nr:sulfoxide reductase heme-binding subunit YedZ [Deltaproteobacteria bacterium]